MTALQIRDVPEDLHRTLAEQANERNISLQKYLLEILEDSARLSRQQKAIQEIVDSPSLNISHEESMRAISEGRRELDERAERLVQHIQQNDN
ncbi:MAG TPA: hypothetical protein PKB15_08505 [Acidimicrobiia bacterium]|nr:hypothetical protein [Acidimicrobiia bacterium]